MKTPTRPAPAKTEQPKEEPKQKIFGCNPEELREEETAKLSHMSKKYSTFAVYKKNKLVGYRAKTKTETFSSESLPDVCEQAKAAIEKQWTDENQEEQE